MTKKLLIVGAAGMLGKGFMQDADRGYPLVGLDLPDIDITSLDSVRSALIQHRPDVLINCAAYTAVDKCETEQVLAYAVNVTGPENLAKVCSEMGIILVHYSTDYVFDGLKSEPYSEDDPTSPQSEYGRTKLGGELAIAQHCSSYYIIRTAWLYGENGNNFVKTMLSLAQTTPSLKVVNDQFGSPTYTRDLIDATYQLLVNAPFGVYHVTGSGQCSWFEFASEIFARQNLEVELRPCTTEQFPRPASRPAYGVLSKEKINRLGIFTRDWPVALAEYLDTMNETR